MPYFGLNLWVEVKILLLKKSGFFEKRDLQLHLVNLIRDTIDLEELQLLTECLSGDT